jgi:hypothetical protein
MKKLFLLAFMFNSAVNLVAGENKVVLMASIEGASPALRYFVTDYETNFKPFGVNAEFKDPFLYVYFNPENCEKLSYNKDLGFVARNQLNVDAHAIAYTCNRLIKCIRQLPLHCFLLTDDSKKLKKKGDELFSFSEKFEDKEFEFIIKLNSDIHGTPEQLMQRFRESPQFWFSNDECKKVEEILIKNEILAKVGEKTVHGKNSIFGDSVIKEEQEEIEIKTKLEKEACANALFYSCLKSCLKFGTLSIGLLILYLVYQKAIKQV